MSMDVVGKREKKKTLKLVYCCGRDRAVAQPGQPELSVKEGSKIGMDHH